MRNIPLRINDSEMKDFSKIKQHLENKSNKKLIHADVISILCDIADRFIDDGHDLSKIHGLCKYGSYSISNDGVNNGSETVQLF